MLVEINEGRGDGGVARGGVLMALMTRERVTWMKEYELREEKLLEQDPAQRYIQEMFERMEIERIEIRIRLLKFMSSDKPRKSKGKRIVWKRLRTG